MEQFRNYLAVWHAVENGEAAKEAIPDIFRTIASGTPCKKAIEKLAPAVSREELEAIVKKIIADRAEFVHQKKMAALGPLMGVVMAEVRGSVDGKVVSEILKREISRAIADFQAKPHGKPVVCSMGNLAASGGYYVSAP